MKNTKDKQVKPAQPVPAPSNKKQGEGQSKNKNPRQEDRSSIDKEIAKRTAENRTPHGENL